MPCFDVEVKKIEHNSVGKISKAAVVDNQALACIDHLCWLLGLVPNDGTVKSP